MNKRIIFSGIGTGILSLAFMSAQVIATPSVGNLAITPSTVSSGTSTVVTVTTLITDPTLIANGVNLLKLGSSSTVLGVMHDDGLNGDAISGDKVFTLQITVNQSAPTTITLQASAAFKGLLKRVLSSPGVITVN